MVPFRHRALLRQAAPMAPARHSSSGALMACIEPFPSPRNSTINPTSSSPPPPRSARMSPPGGPPMAPACLPLSGTVMEPTSIPSRAFLSDFSLGFHHFSSAKAFLPVSKRPFVCPPFYMEARGVTVQYFADFYMFVEISPLCRGTIIKCPLFLRIATSQFSSFHSLQLFLFATTQKVGLFFWKNSPGFIGEVSEKTLQRDESKGDFSKDPILTAKALTPIPVQQGQPAFKNNKNKTHSIQARPSGMAAVCCRSDRPNGD